MSLNNHLPADTKVTVLKIDLEGDEMDILPVAIQQGALENVEQLALEFHLTNGWCEISLDGLLFLVCYLFSDISQNREGQRGIIKVS